MAFARQSREQLSAQQAAEEQPEHFFIGENGLEDPLSRRMSRMNEQLRRLREKDWRPKLMHGIDSNKNGYVGPVSAALSSSLQTAQVTRQLSPRGLLPVRAEPVVVRCDGRAWSPSMRSASPPPRNPRGVPLNLVPHTACLQSGSSSPSRPSNAAVPVTLPLAHVTQPRDVALSPRRSGALSPTATHVRWNSPSSCGNASPVATDAGGAPCGQNTLVAAPGNPTVALRAADRALCAVGLRRSVSAPHGLGGLCQARPAAVLRSSSNPRSSQAQHSRMVQRQLSPRGQHSPTASHKLSLNLSHDLSPSSNQSMAQSLTSSQRPTSPQVRMHPTGFTLVVQPASETSPHHSQRIEAFPSSFTQARGELQHNTNVSEKAGNQQHVGHAVDGGIAALRQAKAEIMCLTEMETTPANLQETVTLHMGMSGQHVGEPLSHAMYRTEVKQDGMQTFSQETEQSLLELRAQKIARYKLSAQSTNGHAHQISEESDIQPMGMYGLHAVEPLSQATYTPEVMLEDMQTFSQEAHGRVPFLAGLRRCTATFGTENEENLRDALQERNKDLQLTTAILSDREAQIKALQERTHELEEAQAERELYDVERCTREQSTSNDDDHRRQKAQEAVRARVRNEVLRADSEVLRTELAERDLVVEQLRRTEADIQQRATEVVRAVRAEVAENLMRQETLNAEMQEVELQRHFTEDRISRNSFLQLLGISPDTPAFIQRARLAKGLTLLRELVREFSDNGTCFPQLSGMVVLPTEPVASSLCLGREGDEAGAIEEANAVLAHPWAAAQAFEAMPSIPEESPRCGASGVSQDGSPCVVGSAQCEEH